MDADVYPVCRWRQSVEGAAVMAVTLSRLSCLGSSEIADDRQMLGPEIGAAA